MLTPLVSHKEAHFHVSSGEVCPLNGCPLTSFSYHAIFHPCRGSSLCDLRGQSPPCAPTHGCLCMCRRQRAEAVGRGEGSENGGDKSGAAAANTSLDTVVWQLKPAWGACPRPLSPRLLPGLCPGLGNPSTAAPGVMLSLRKMRKSPFPSAIQKGP